MLKKSLITKWETFKNSLMILLNEKKIQETKQSNFYKIMIELKKNLKKIMNKSLDQK